METGGKQLTVRRPRISFVLGIFIDHHQSIEKSSKFSHSCMHVSYSILFQRLSLGQHGPGLTCDFADETLYILRPVLHYCKYKMLYYCVDIFLTYHVWQFVVCSSSIEYYCCALKWKLGIVLKGFIIIDDGLRPLPCT